MRMVNAHSRLALREEPMLLTVDAGAQGRASG